MKNHGSIDAIKAKIAKAESDSHTWQVAEDEEKYLEAYDRTEALELQLDQQFKKLSENNDVGPNLESHSVLNKLSNFFSVTVSATDGYIGHIKTAFFDDQSWTIRYLVVNTGSWLSKHEVLVSPYSIKQPLGVTRNVDINLTRLQVKDSPDIDTHQPVSRQHERQFMAYYSFPAYWEGEYLWGTGRYPLLSMNRPSQGVTVPEKELELQSLESKDVHLRSCAEIAGYNIQANDDSIGHVKDFIFDEASWSIRYLVIDTRNWLPGGRKVLIATQWIEIIDWATRNVYIKLTQEQVKNSPEYTDDFPLDRAYENRLHESYNRRAYWT